MMRPFAHREFPSRQDGRQSKPFALLIGMDCLQGLQASRILARHGVPVIGFASEPGHFCCKTGACQDVRAVNTGGEELIALLERMAPDFAEPPVLLPCQDESVLLISRHRQRLEGSFRFSLPDPGVVEIALNKSLFYRFAESHDFAVPRSFTIRSREELESRAQLLGFPCILKPGGRSPVWKENSAFKAFKVCGRQELQQIYEKCRNWSDILILQEWIPGSDAELYSCNVYFDATSKPLVTFVARKLRQWPPEVGESCLGEECRNDQILHESLRLFSAMGLRGLGYLEMKRDPCSGRHVIIEPNIGRPTGRSAIAEAGGVELLYTMYCDLLGWPLPEARDQKFTGVKWIHLVRDCASALHYWRRGELSFSDWLRSVRGRKAYAVFSLTDPAPFCGDVLRAARLLLSPRELRRRRPQGGADLPEREFVTGGTADPDRRVKSTGCS